MPIRPPIELRQCTASTWSRRSAPSCRPRAAERRNQTVAQPMATPAPRRCGADDAMAGQSRERSSKIMPLRNSRGTRTGACGIGRGRPFGIAMRMQARRRGALDAALARLPCRRCVFVASLFRRDDAAPAYPTIAILTAMPGVTPAARYAAPIRRSHPRSRCSRRRDRCARRDADLAFQYLRARIVGEALR